MVPSRFGGTQTRKDFAFKGAWIGIALARHAFRKRQKTGVMGLPAAVEVIDRAFPLRVRVDF
jgi:hypothetical protein